MAKAKKAAGPAQPSLFETGTAAPGAPQRDFHYWHDFYERLRDVTDPSALDKALTMLRKERFQLFSDVAPDHVLGVVRSQSSPKRVYSCRLASDGKYACCTQNLITCVVSYVSPCKHLLVLVLGMVNAGWLDPDDALAWLGAAFGNGRALGASHPDKEQMTATFLRYKGVEAGEVDWRPTETIPEDFYAF